MGRSCRAILEFCLPQAPIGKNPNAHQRRIDELQYIHTMELPLALKRDKLLIYAITQMNLKNIMLNTDPRVHTLWFHSHEILELT